MTYQEIERYCKERLQEIEAINHYSHTPTAFVPLAAFIAFLAKLAYYGRQKSGGNGLWTQESDYFSEFGSEFFPKDSRGNPRYDPKDMYTVLRCGIVHSFSFDDKWRPEKYPARSLPIGHSKIIITHNADRRGTSPSPLSSVESNVLVINAFDLCDDVADMIRMMFSDQCVQVNAENVVKHQRLIQDIDSPMLSQQAQIVGATPASPKDESCVACATTGLSGSSDKEILK